MGKMAMGQALTWLVMILFGGVGGAALTWYATERRNRIQPIGLEVSMFTLDPNIKHWPLEATLTLRYGVEEWQVDRLYLVTIEIANTSNRDFPEFRFGTTLPMGLVVIDLLCEGGDRHHQGDPINTASGLILSKEEMMAKSHALDYRLSPFSRKDRYSLRLTIAPMNHLEDGRYIPNDAVMSVVDVEVGTPETGVRFADLSELEAGMSSSSFRQRYLILNVVAGIISFTVLGVNVVMTTSGQTPPMWLRVGMLVATGVFMGVTALFAYLQRRTLRTMSRYTGRR